MSAAEDRRDALEMVRAIAQADADRAETALRIRAKGLRLRFLAATDTEEKARVLTELHSLPTVAQEWRRVYRETRERLLPQC